MGNSQSGAESGMPSNDPHHKHRRISNKATAGTNAGTTDERERIPAGAPPRPGSKVAGQGGVHHERRSTASNTEKTLILAVKSGLIKDDDVDAAGKSSPHAGISQQIKRERDVTSGEQTTCEKSAESQQKSEQKESEAEVKQQVVVENQGHKKCVSEQRTVAGVVIESAETGEQPVAKLENLQPFGVGDQMSADCKTARLREDRGTQYDVEAVADGNKPIGSSDTRQNGNAGPLLDGREVLSRLQQLEDEKLKLQHENKALKAIVDDMTTRYMPNSRGRTPRPVSKGKDDQREMVKKYLELYNREWTTARRRLDQLSPLGRGSKFEKYHLQFLCDVYVAAFTITRRAVHEFEDRLTSLLLNAVHYPSNKTQEEASLRRRGVALYSSVIDPSPDLKAAFKQSGDTSANFLKQLLQSCPVNDVIDEVHKELKKEWSSTLLSAVDDNKEVKEFIEKSCRVAFQMNILRPHIEISHKGKKFSATRHDPELATDSVSIKDATVDLHIWPTLLDASDNVLVKGKVRIVHFL